MQITTGKIPSAQKVLLYGVEGIGKSTLAASFADPLFIDVEGSTKHMDVRGYRGDSAPQSWTMLLEQIRSVICNPSTCRTLVIDTADWAEALCISHVCAVHQWDGIEDPGYGKGYTYLEEEFGKLLNHLSECVERGINVIITAHSQVKQFKAPDESTPYDRWELKLQKKTAAMVREWSDAVIFANYETFAVTDSKTKKTTGQGGKRTLYATHRPAWDAKNRHGLPDKMQFEDGKGQPIMPPELLAAVPAIEIAVSAPPAPTAQEAPAPPTGKVLEQVVADATGGEIVNPLPETQPVQPTLPEEPKHLKSLRQLMDKDGVSEDELRSVVAAKGYFPIGTEVDKYPTDFVEGALIAAWPMVIEAINAAKLADAPLA
jgi:AAA domain